MPEITMSRGTQENTHI